MTPGTPLTEEEKSRYEWQLDIAGYGEAAQERLKGSSVLISRVGGVGGAAAYELAAAGVGRLVLAHGGNLRPSDLNRQLLMTTDHVGRPRIEKMVERLRELNPQVEYVGVGSNISEENAVELVSQVDLVVDCAPLFEERYLMNREAVLQGKPMVESAMYDLEGSLTTFLPGRSGCLACLYPEKSGEWKRRFPVFGAVAGTVGCMAAMEAIKVLTGVGTPLAGRLLRCDLRTMEFRTFQIHRDPQCPVCRGVGEPQPSGKAASTS